MDKKTTSIYEVQLRSFIESLRPTEEETRKLLDFGYIWDGQTAFLFEIRPKWNNPTEIQQHHFAKIRYMKSSKIWKLYWLRASGKWELYEPHPGNANLHELFTEIKNDVYHCFFG